MDEQTDKKLDAATPRKPDPVDFIEDVFLGKLSLPMTYWVYGVLGNLVWGIGFRSLDLTLDGDPFALLFTLYVGYSIWVSVGIWRSAGKYLGLKVWAILAKFVVIVGLLQLAVAYFRWLSTYQGL